MPQSHRPKVITGNWKMNKTLKEAQTFVETLIPSIEGHSTQVYLAVPYTMIQTLVKKSENTKLVIGAQNMNDASEGAFTGEIAASMLKDVGAKFVLLGHSERRRYFHEDNAFINRKVKRAIKDHLQPVLCIGETKEEYDEGQTQEVLRRQLKECLAGIETSDIENLIIAYEPVWAIGTGYTPTPEEAQKMHLFCRELLGEIFNVETAQKIIIQYGGSVTAINAKDLLNEPDIDGLLIGGASLSLETFVKIIDDSESILNFKVESV
ncbi:MAG: triose-phosphate isomerase [Parachlamydiaceae bacterium]|nr:triose-phosphate isomerase [Parachlamydiaceae bacterium]